MQLLRPRMWIWQITQHWACLYIQIMELVQHQRFLVPTIPGSGYPMGSQVWLDGSIGRMFMQWCPSFRLSHELMLVITTIYFYLFSLGGFFFIGRFLPLHGRLEWVLNSHSIKLDLLWVRRWIPFWFTLNLALHGTGNQTPPSSQLMLNHGVYQTGSLAETPRTRACNTMPTGTIFILPIVLLELEANRGWLDLHSRHEIRPRPGYPPADALCCLLSISS